MVSLQERSLVKSLQVLFLALKCQWKQVGLEIFSKGAKNVQSVANWGRLFHARDRSTKLVKATCQWN